MNTLVVKYSDVKQVTILGAANELLELALLLSNNGSFVERALDVGLTILSKRLGTNEFIFAEIKDFLFGEIEKSSKMMEARFENGDEYSEFISKKFDELYFDEDSLDHWTRFFAVGE